MPGHPNWPATVKYFCAGNVPLKHINHYSSQGCTLRPRHSIAYQVQCDGCDEAMKQSAKVPSCADYNLEAEYRDENGDYNNIQLGKIR